MKPFALMGGSAVSSTSWPSNSAMEKVGGAERSTLQSLRRYVNNWSFISSHRDRVIESSFIKLFSNRSNTGLGRSGKAPGLFDLSNERSVRLVGSGIKTDTSTTRSIQLKHMHAHTFPAHSLHLLHRRSSPSILSQHHSRPSRFDKYHNAMLCGSRCVL